MSKQITITEAQAKVVQQSLDAAIRAGGANAAVIVLPIMQTIERQLVPQATNQEASQEALAVLASPNPEI